MILKYIAALILLSFLFDIGVSAFFVLISLIILPFAVYFSFDKLSESIAQGALVFLLGGLLNYIFGRKIAKFPSILYKVLGTVYFLSMLVYGILLQLSILVRS